MADIAEHASARAGMYLVIAAVAVVVWAKERRAVDSESMWPAFWLWTAGLLVVMAVARITELGQVFTELGRERSRTEGWYDLRRAAQGVIVATISVAWFAVTSIAIWRVRGHRRRYFPTAIAIFALLCYGLVRIVSLHQIDAVLYRWTAWDVRAGTIVEYAVGAVAFVLVLWRCVAPATNRSRFIVA